MSVRIGDGSFVQVNRTANYISLVITPPFKLTFGLSRRANEVRRRVRRVLKLSTATIKEEGGTIEARFHVLNEQRVLDAAAEIDKRLMHYLNEKLPARVVEKVLGISPQERARWTKDGCLPKSGTMIFKKGGTKFEVYLHPVEGIAYLLASPHILADWREHDALAGDKGIDVQNTSD